MRRTRVWGRMGGMSEGMGLGLIWANRELSSEDVVGRMEK